MTIVLLLEMMAKWEGFVCVCVYIGRRVEGFIYVHFL